MDMMSSIAQFSTTMKQADLMSQVSIKLMDKAMDTQAAQAEQLIQGMSEGVPSFNHLLDTYA
ncbi:MAG: putative motility protein [Ruminococcus sp.]|nr:putative motility protein [Ruminococcus sp.]